MTHSDEFIDHWGEVFERLKMDGLLGITLPEFLECPRDHLNAVRSVYRVDDYKPLLPEQRAVQARVDATDLDAAEVEAALRRMETGNTRADDSMLIRRALGTSRLGRRLLADMQPEVAG